MKLGHIWRDVRAAGGCGPQLSEDLQVRFWARQNSGSGGFLADNSSRSTNGPDQQNQQRRPGLSVRVGTGMKSNIL